MPFSLKFMCAMLLAAVGMAAPAVAFEGTRFDGKHAVIFAYFNVGDDSNPNINIRREQFLEQMQELREGPYTILPLPDIVAAFQSGQTLPDRTVAITFDGADQSVLDLAAPYLIEHGLPFTIFIPAGRVDDGKAPYMTWGDLRDLKESGLVTFGLHPSSYGHIATAPEAEIRRQLNNALVLVRRELGTDPKLVAYPYGEYTQTFKDIVTVMGFDAAFGQQSGVAHAGDDLFALPRFTITERYGDLERFRMTAAALPLPVKDISPADPFLETNAPPAIGFTLPASLREQAKALSCFSSLGDKPDLQIIHSTRIELRLPAIIDEDRPRINCTMPVPAAKAGEETRWRWFGLLFTVKNAAETPPPTMDAQKTPAISTGYVGLE